MRKIRVWNALDDDSRLCPVLLHGVDMRDVPLLANGVSLRDCCLKRGQRRLEAAVAAHDGGCRTPVCVRSESTRSVVSTADSEAAHLLTKFSK